MSARKLRSYRVTRWLIQLSLLAVFVLLFALTRLDARVKYLDAFYRLDPLVLLVASIAARALVAAGLLSLVFIAATLVFGRFFCGFVCPLGTVIDVFDSAIRRKPGPGSRLSNGKYLVLLFLLVAAALHGSWLGLFDPLVIAGRSLALLFYPAAHFLHARFVPAKPVVFKETWISLTTLLAIIGTGLVAHRFWCRNLCPLGGLYALFSRFSLLKFSFADKCRNCGLCDRVCPTGAIDSAQRRIDSAECIDCLACRYECPERSIRFRGRSRPVAFDAGRREAILALGTGIVLAPLASRLIRSRPGDRLIRPPGALPEPDFLNACIRCGRCMKVCPTNALQPCIMEAGTGGLWSPRLVPRIGPCERNCRMCGQVCPTGAIRNLTLEDKSYAKLGTAVIDRNRCIAWTEDKSCLICDEACQYNAIDALEAEPGSTKPLRPSVEKQYCVGCGMCESRCPVAGPAAIQVFRIEEDRRRFGSYKAGGKVQRRECGQTPKEAVPSGFIQG